jgi:hypothetical protein
MFERSELSEALAELTEAKPRKKKSGGASEVGRNAVTE